MTPEGSRTLRVLVSGAGIAGLTAAALLRRAGHRVLVVEQSRGARDPGYMIDFFGPGYDVAERMSLLLILESIHHPIPRLEFLDSAGRSTVVLKYASLRRRLFGGRHFNVLRGDLAAVLLRRACDNGAEVRFGTSIVSLVDSGDIVTARLSDGSLAPYDLIVGADGIHSHVRALAFGTHAAYERYLGYEAAAYIVDNPALAAAAAGAFSTLAIPGRQVAIYPIGDGRVATFFLFESRATPGKRSPATMCAALCKQYDGLSWRVPDLLSECPTAQRPYYDAVAQVEMTSWSHGRVVLVGDACYAVSLLAGQGASLAMAGAHALAQAIRDADGDVPAAVSLYERRFRPIVARRQRAGRRLARWFLPHSAWRLWLRNALLRTATWPGAAAVVRRSLLG